MKRHYSLTNDAADALLPVLFRQSSNAREGWYSKEVVVSISHFNKQNSKKNPNSSANADNQQQLQQQ
jgi:hypothetical protein